MAAKIIGKINTFPSTMYYQEQAITLEQWIDLMLERQSQCSSYWCYHNWVYDVATQFKQHGVPIPAKKRLPWKEYSVVLANKLDQMASVLA